MPVKRRRSSASEEVDLPVTKKPRSKHPLDHLSDLSDELLIRILHHLPVRSLQDCQRLSHRFYTLAADSQIWKNLYYTRFVLPRALRIPGVRALLQQDDDDDVLHYASRRSKWLDENTLVHRQDGKQTDWKGQYKLRHNWSIGACEVQEIHVADSPPAPSMLVRLAEGVVVTADRDEGLRAWDLKEKGLIASCVLDQDIVPTCLAVDEQVSTGLGIAVGFMNGGWGTWRLEVQAKAFTMVHMHPASSNGTLSAIAFAQPYVLTITDAQLLSLYTCDPKITIFDAENTIEDEVATVNTQIPKESEIGAVEVAQTSDVESPTQQPHLLASLKSHTSWPPLSLSIRTTSNTLIASIAYSLPTYLSGYTVGLQELHLSLHTGLITFSRLASALPQGFSSLSPSSSPTSSSPARMSGGRVSTRPTSLSYSHPYILATHPDNTLTLFLCMSDANNLSISSGTKLWGHTSSVSAAEITPRGKAVSVSTRGNELRVWELEGGLSSPSSASRKRVTPSRSRLTDRSVRVQVEGKEGNENEGNVSEYEAKKQWVGFNDELVIVLKESEKGAAALVVYDFT